MTSPMTASRMAMGSSSVMKAREHVTRNLGCQVEPRDGFAAAGCIPGAPFGYRG